MIIDIKHNVGEKIRFRLPQDSSEYSSCTFCDGSGKISGYDNSVAICPVCKGIGEVQKKVFVEGESTIRIVTVNYNSKTDLAPKVVYICDGYNIPADNVLE